MPRRYCCCRALHTELRRRTIELVGPPTNLDDRAAIGFTAVMDGSCALTVSLNDACGLDDVYELCEQIADACLHEDTDVTFTRDQPPVTDS
jgi:hypothetical protein